MLPCPLVPREVRFAAGGEVTSLAVVSLLIDTQLLEGLHGLFLAFCIARVMSTLSSVMLLWPSLVVVAASLAGLIAGGCLLIPTT